MQGWRILITLVLAVCVGCSSDSGESGQAGNVPPPPEVGQCRNTPDTNVGSDVWADDSPVVDCSETHTLQTLEVIETDENVTAELVGQLAKYCTTEAAGRYVGQQDDGWWNASYPLVYGPTPEQTEAGQSWVRCDVGIPATTGDDPPLAPQTVTMQNGLSEHRARYLMCLDAVPDLDRDHQQLSSCEEPHRAEGLFEPIELDVEEYPSGAALKREGQSGCAELVADREEADKLILTPAWIPKDEWDGGTLFGQCWIHLESGLLPAL